MDNIKHEEIHKENYYSQLGFDIKKLLKKKIANLNTKQAADFPTIPEVDETAAPKGPETPEAPKAPSTEKPKSLISGKDSDELLKKIDELESTVQEMLSEETLQIFKEDLLKEVRSITKKVQEELDELKSRQVPETGTVDSGGVYKERIYDVAVRVLDRVLIQFFEDIPDYSLIAVHVSRTFDDGTVSDAIVSVNVAIPNSGYRYDFKVDVPILNGIIHYPQYIQRGQKIIPLTKEKITDELNSMAFRKIEIENPYSKTNTFNNIGDNIHKRPDSQKFYKVDNANPKTVGMPPKSNWPVRRLKEDFRS